jgi:GH24 family phage-related lysozyme (muramidase)
MAMHASVLPALRSFLGTHEGVCNFMYLDTRGLVTTGIGNLIDPRNRAYAYSWLRNSDNAVATRAEVNAEWDQIKHRQADRVRGGLYFRQFATLHLTDAELQRIFNLKATQFDTSLARIFPQWATYPADAQLAMLVHAWALGTGRLRSGWPRYTASCTRRDWRAASTECEWRGMNQQRLRGMREMFQNAAALEESNQRGFHFDLTRVHFPTIVMEPTSVPGS